MSVNGYNAHMSIDAKLLTMLRVVDRVKGCSQVVAPPLPEANAEHLASIYKALGDPTRLQILHILGAATDPVCVCDFTAAFELGQPTISHHLAKLREAGMVTSFKRGIWAFYRLDPDMSPAARAAVDLLQ
jgi:ArsR family transcriptional regulator, arsenate/arsenite/antimonite-responsive transcriptional repressor